jgi:hypothetical protein
MEVKCRICGEKSPKEMMTKEKYGYAHPICIKQKERDNADREELFKKIIEIFKIDFPNGFMLKQMKEFRQRGYTYRGMTLALEWFFQVEKKPITVQTIGIIPYVYDKARIYYKELRDKQKKLDQVKKIEGTTEYQSGAQKKEASNIVKTYTLDDM